MAEKVEALRMFLLSYQYALRALVKAIPEPARRSRAPFSLIGKFEIWPCRDAAVVLLFPSEENEISVVVKPATRANHEEFFGRSEAGTFYDSNGQPVTWRVVIKVDDASEHGLHAVDMESFGALGDVRPAFNGFWIFGWNAALPIPDEQALRAFRSELSAQNFGASMTMQRRVDWARSKLGDFRRLLDSGAREEEAQSFLRDNPQLLYPDYIEFHSKMKLADLRVTDFVFVVPGTGGMEHVFVEIERPEKPVFVGNGQFSSQFTQAKDQLLQWAQFIRRDHRYLSDKLQGLGKPKFHLVMGRSSEIDQTRRDRLQDEFIGTEREFSTYDDVAARFERFIENFLESR